MSTNQCSTVTNHGPSIKTDFQRATPSLFFSLAELFVSSTTKSYWLKLVMDLKWGPVGSLAAEMAVYWITGLIWFGAQCVNQNAQPPQRELYSSPDFWTFPEKSSTRHIYIYFLFLFRLYRCKLCMHYKRHRFFVKPVFINHCVFIFPFKLIFIVHW